MPGWYDDGSEQEYQARKEAALIDKPKKLTTEEYWAAHKQKAISTRLDRQPVVSDWGVRAFGAEQTYSLPRRGLMLLEEATEAAQAAGVTRELAHKMIDYVFSRPVGELAQELGGVGICVLALAQAAGLDADKCEVDELNRVLAKPIEHFTKRNQAKNDAEFLAVKEEEN